MTTYDKEQFEGLVSPPGTPDLLDAHVARLMSLAITTTSIGRYDDPLFETMKESPDYEKYRPWLAEFDAWAKSQHGGDMDGWLRFMASHAIDLESRLFDAYDPEGLLDKETRLSIGDSIIGAALWFGFLRQRGTVSEEDETRFVNLWCWMFIQDILPGNEPAAETSDDEWQ